MLFNSLDFLIFFPVVTAGYFVLPHRFRWAWLLIASCYFYMAFIPAYILILFFVITIDYVAGIAIENALGRRRKLFLLMSLLANIGTLAIFKYFNFLNGNLAGLATAFHWNYPIPALAIILPIGLSFHTFQSMSYTIEVYRGKFKAERHPGIFALYVMFFPQLVAGPIERPYNLLPQLHAQHTFDYQRVTDGLKLMAWGFFKKIVIADRLAIPVNQVYANPHEYTGISLIVATIFFAYQIYCDFSGYSDIAIGAAQVMGFKLMTNFNRPYFSQSIAEFWRRWHISLSSWFRDYLYIPLGGNRVAAWRWQLNLLIVFLVSGLWHGASWTFVIWGGLHGLYLVASLWLTALAEKIQRATKTAIRPNKYLQIAITFGLVSFAWIFFRATSLADALYIASHLFDNLGIVTNFQALENSVLLGLGRTGFAIALLAIIGMELVQLVQRGGSVRAQLARQPALVRWSAYYLLIIVTLIFGVYGSRQFIYFQF